MSQIIAPSGDGQCPVSIPSLFNEFMQNLAGFRSAFHQARTADRAINFILGLLLTMGRKTCMASRYWRNQFDDESADLKVFSRSRWDIHRWFDVVLEQVLTLLSPSEPLVIGIDDTGLPKTGKGIPQARYVHNPLAIKWARDRMMWGIRMLHLSALLPFGYEAGRPYAIPVSFSPKPAAKKPRLKYLTEEELAAYQAAKKSSVLTRYALQAILALRDQLDRLGHAARHLLVVVDSSFMNGPVAGRVIPGVDVVGRFRGDACLFARATNRMGNTFYGDRLPTPWEYEQDPNLHWKTVSLWWGGKQQDIKIKVVPEVYWKSGTKKRPMRLIILQGTPFTPRNKKQRHAVQRNPRKYRFRRSGYLLTTDLTSDVAFLIQKYLDRWAVEQVHRDVKSGLGIHHPQVSNEMSVDRIPSAMVAAYSLWSLTVLKRFGPNWTPEAVPLRPRQQKRVQAQRQEGKTWGRRFSQQDLIRILRNEIENAYHWGDLVHLKAAPDGFELPVRMSFTA